MLHTGSSPGIAAYPFCMGTITKHTTATGDGDDVEHVSTTHRVYAHYSCGTPQAQQHGIHSTTPDAAAFAQLILYPAITLAAARLLRPLLPAAVHALVHAPASSTQLRLIALLRVLHIAPHLTDAMLPWLSAQDAPWTWMVNSQHDGQHDADHDGSQTMLRMPPSSFVLLTVLHVLPMLPSLRTAWSPSLLVALVGGAHGGSDRAGGDGHACEDMEVDGGVHDGAVHEQQQQQHEEDVVRWAALQCLGWYLGFSDATLRCVWGRWWGVLCLYMLTMHVYV